MDITTEPQSEIITCVGYVRASTGRQVLTLEAQQEQIQRYCAFRSNLKLANVYTDSGVSAETVPFFEREAVSQMFTDMPGLGATAIIISKLDRGFRDELDCLFTVEALEKRGIGLHLLDLGGAALDLSTSIGRYILHMTVAAAGFEQRRRKERTKAAHDLMKKKRQRIGFLPYGWQTSPTDAKQMVEDFSEQRIIYRLTQGDLSSPLTPAYRAAATLNAEGIPTKNGGAWYASTVTSIRTKGQLSEKFVP